MADGNYKIRIGSEADVRGITQATDALGRATDAADQFVESIKAGVGIDIGGRIVSSVLRLPEILKAATMEGVGLNAQLQDGTRGLAALIGQFDSTAPADFAARNRMAAEAIEELREKGLLAEGTFAQLFAAMSASSGSAFAGGIGDLSQQIDLLVASSQVLGALGGDQAQLGQQLNQILSGNIDPANRLNQVLRLTGKEVKALAAEGTLFEEIMRRFAPTLRDAEQGLDSYTSQLTIWQETLDNLKTDMARPVFDVLTEGLQDLNASLEDPAARDALRDLGFDIAALVAAGVDLTQWAIENADALLLVAKGAAALAVAFAAIKVKDILLGLGLKVVALGRSKLAIDAETASLAANTAAQGANATARRAGAAGGGFLGRPTGAGLNGAANIGLAGGLLVNQAMHSWAADKNAQTAESASIGKEISGMAQGYAALVRNLSSAEEKAEALKSIDEDIASLRERIAGASEEDAETLDLAVRQLSRMKTILEAVSDERMKANAAAKQGAALDGFNVNEILDPVSKKLEDSAEAERLQKAAGTGNWRAIDAAIAKKQSDLDAAGQQMATGSSVEEVTAAVEAVNKLRLEMADLQKLRESAGEVDDEAATTRGDENDQRAIATMEHALEIQETINGARLDNLKATGASEEAIAAKRKQLEDELAASRLEAEKRIALLQGASAEQLAQIDAKFAAQQQARDAAAAAEMANLRKPDAGEAAKKRWEEAGTGREGTIDARSQRTFDAGGNLISERGENRFGTDRFGRPVAPSMLDTFAAETAARRAGGLPGSGASLSALLPPAATPAEVPAGEASGGPQAGPRSDGAAAALKSIEKSLQEIARNSQGAADAARSGASSSAAATQELQKAAQGLASLKNAISDLKAKVEAMEESR